MTRIWNFLRLLQTAEMLLPNMNAIFSQQTPSSGMNSSGTGGQDDMIFSAQQQHHVYEHRPHLSKISLQLFLLQTNPNISTINRCFYSFFYLTTKKFMY